MPRACCPHMIGRLRVCAPILCVCACVCGCVCVWGEGAGRGGGDRGAGRGYRPDGIGGPLPVLTAVQRPSAARPHSLFWGARARACNVPASMQPDAATPRLCTRWGRRSNPPAIHTALLTLAAPPPPTHTRALARTAVCSSSSSAGAAAATGTAGMAAGAAGAEGEAAGVGAGAGGGRRRKPGACTARRCFGTRGAWCQRYEAAAPVPWAAPPLGSKDCPETPHGPCNGVGNCNAASGLCECPAGRCLCL
jgi:hypothetical protein